MAGNRRSGSRHYARCVLGEGPGQNRFNVSRHWLQSEKKPPVFHFANILLRFAFSTMVLADLVEASVTWRRLN